MLGAGSTPVWKLIIWLQANSEQLQMKHHIDRDNFNLYYVWQYFAVTSHADAKEGWAKSAICKFVTKASVHGALLEQQHIS